MITVPRSNCYDRNTWKPLQTEHGLSATFTCPNGHTGVLTDHEILDNGSVHPSVLCSFDGCGFHEFIKLNEWTPA